MLQGPRPDAGIAVEDWDILLGAVTARLREAVTATLPHELNGATSPLQASVLDCVDALEQLHATVRLALEQPASLVWPDGSGIAPQTRALKIEAAGAVVARP